MLATKCSGVASPQNWQACQSLCLPSTAPAGPDSVGRLNRLLTPLTDAFIGVADAHAEHLAKYEKFPRDKVHTVYNGIDTEVFLPGDGSEQRQQLGIPADAPVVGILAALRPEKNHELFLNGAKQITAAIPQCPLRSHW